MAMRCPCPALASLETAAGAEGPPPREVWRSEAVRGSLDRCYRATVLPLPAAAGGRDRGRSGTQANCLLLVGKAGRPNNRTKRNVQEQINGIKSKKKESIFTSLNFGPSPLFLPEF